MEEPPPTETGGCGTHGAWEIFHAGENIYIYIYKTQHNLAQPNLIFSYIYIYVY